jgi:hypothetical protein
MELVIYVMRKLNDIAHINKSISNHTPSYCFNIYIDKEAALKYVPVAVHNLAFDSLF